MAGEKKKQKTCYLYTRVSTAIQVDGYSLEAQEERLRKEADHRGYKVIEVYPDEGKSGKNIAGRDKFKKMLEDIRTRKDKPDYVFVFKLSRFGRNAADTLNSLQILEDYGVSLLCVEDGIDSAGAAGKLMIAVYAAVAEAERENIHVQTMAGRWQKAKNGGWNGGFAPYGYKLEDGELKIAEDEADLVREIFKTYIEGKVGINTVARRLNEKGYKKKIRNNANTDRIGSSFVKAVLDNPIYAGYLPYGRRKNEKIEGTRNEFHIVKQSEYEMFEGKHEAIISRETWEIAHKKREENGYVREKTHSLEHSHILSGLLKCPICGAPLYGNVNRKKKKDGSGYYKDCWYYVCKNRRTVGGTPCTFKKYVKQDDINMEMFGIVADIFQRDSVNEGRAIDFLNEELDIDSLKEKLKELSNQRRTTESKKNKMLAKMADMDAEDPLYDELYANYDGLIRGFTTELVDLDSQIREIKASIDSNGARRESVERVKEIINTMWDHLDMLPQEYVKQFMNSFIDNIQIYEEPDRIDGVNFWVKSLRFKVPMFKGTPNEFDTIEFRREFQPNGEHGECVVLITRSM
jgi:site-specific DNA recombinase